MHFNQLSPCPYWKHKQENALTVAYKLYKGETTKPHEESGLVQNIRTKLKPRMSIKDHFTKSIGIWAFLLIAFIAVFLGAGNLC